MTEKPICYDLFTGLHGWLEAFRKEGFRCIGFDIENMCAAFGRRRPAGIEFRRRDVRSIHGSELKDAAIIVASPPCQEPSYRSMPWQKAKALNAIGPPHNFIDLFNQCFRIQREASEAAGHYIPLIVENVVGAQRWVGKAQWHYGSYYLWGDVPALMPPAILAQKRNPDGTNHGQGSWFKIADSKNRGIKTQGHINIRNGHAHTRHLTNHAEGVKGFTSNGEPLGKNTLGRRHSSKSRARKEASALIAKIPYPLASHIAKVYKPRPDAIERSVNGC